VQRVPKARRDSFYIWDSRYPHKVSVFVILRFLHVSDQCIDRGNVLESTCFRLALISALRSKKMGGKMVGLMVTASHNPEEVRPAPFDAVHCSDSLSKCQQDNGLKAVDPRGEMLESSWESYCTAAANATTTVELISVLTTLIKTAKIDVNAPSSVIYGHDTRPTSPALVKAIAEGLAVMGSRVIDAGLKTTPQLHYLVLAHNTQGTPESYGEPTEEGYYKKLSTAFLKLVVSGSYIHL
jgi:phosphoacetylglucosamine mutase